MKDQLEGFSAAMHKNLHDAVSKLEVIICHLHRYGVEDLKLELELELLGIM